MKESNKNWYDFLKQLWFLYTCIAALVVALIAFIIYNKTLVADINSLERDLTKLYQTVDRIENSDLRMNREWKWELQSILVSRGIIKIEAGIMKEAK